MVSLKTTVKPGSTLEQVFGSYTTVSAGGQNSLTKQVTYSCGLVAGTYQGQWLRGMRHGYGVRASAPFGMASHYRPNKTVRASMTSLRSTEAGGGSTVGGAADPSAERDRRVDDSRGGFVLKARSDEPPARRRSLVEKGSNIKSIFSVRTAYTFAPRLGVKFLYTRTIIQYA